MYAERSPARMKATFTPPAASTPFLQHGPKERPLQNHHRTQRHGHTARYHAILLLSAAAAISPNARALETAVPPENPSHTLPSTKNNAGPISAMLGKNWDASLPVAEFLVSEKLDGVRALWDGQTFRFRSGRSIAAPAWFLERLPPTPLDGELWIARRQFEQVSAAVRRNQALDADWRTIRYMVFDIPGDKRPFAQRTAHLAQIATQTATPWLIAVPHIRLADTAALNTHMQNTLAQGGEGLMLHRAQALWQTGRSDDLRKLKPSPDEEGRVLAYIAGKGQLQGRMGALLLQAPDGQHFALGTGFSQAQRDNPPPLGSLVTYRFRDRTAKGLPRFASFVRVHETF
jgi:DNA ligase-1